MPDLVTLVGVLEMLREEALEDRTVDDLAGVLQPVVHDGRVARRRGIGLDLGSRVFCALAFGIAEVVGAEVLAPGALKGLPPPRMVRGAPATPG